MNQQSQCSTLPNEDQRGEVALRDKVKENLDELHASGVIEHCSMTPGRRFRDLLNR